MDDCCFEYHRKRISNTKSESPFLVLFTEHSGIQEKYETVIPEEYMNNNYSLPDHIQFDHFTDVSDECSSCDVCLTFRANCSMRKSGTSSAIELLVDVASLDTELFPPPQVPCSDLDGSEVFRMCFFDDEVSADVSLIPVNVAGEQSKQVKFHERAALSLSAAEESSMGSCCNELVLLSPPLNCTSPAIPSHCAFRTPEIPCTGFPGLFMFHISMHFIDHSTELIDKIIRLMANV